MPQSIYTLAKGKSKAEAEKLWKQAVKISKEKFNKNKSDFTDKEYAYTMGVYKKSLGISESIINEQIETEGEKLIKKFGLGKLDAVYASRVLGFPIPILLIIYDSHRTRLPLSRTYIMDRMNTSLFFGRKELTYLPFFDLKDYNGTKKMIYLINDLAGSYLQDGRYKENIEKIEKPDKVIWDSYDTLKEFVTMADLMKSQGMSDFTKKTRKKRNSVLRTENQLAKLVDLDINKKENYITFKWITDATTPLYPDDYKFKNTKPKQDFKLVNDPSKTYTLEIRILDFFSWLDVFEGQEITEKEIKEIFNVSNVQVFSDDPSYHWQGINWWMSQLNGSIYPTNIKPKRWNAPNLHGEDNAFLSKHLGGLINGIKFWYNPMASMLNKKLKEFKLL